MDNKTYQMPNTIPECVKNVCSMADTIDVRTTVRDDQFSVRYRGIQGIQSVLRHPYCR